MPEPQKIKSEKKPQARGFNPHAMAQAQVLNQQPDSIPAMMKPGEYVLPPDTVAAMGGPQALDATVAQTHTPTNAGAIVPKGFEPRLFFSSGGLAQEEETKQVPTAAPAAPAPASAQTPRAQFVADQNAKLATANARLAERTQEMNARYQPAPNSPTNTFPANRLQVESGATSAQPAASVAAPTQPSRGAAGFLANAFPGTTAAVQGSMEDAKEAYRQGGVGALLGTSARVAATPLIGLADDVYSSAAKVVRPVTDTALQAGKTALTGDVSPINPLQHGAGAGQETSTGATSKTPQRSPFNASTAVDSTYGLAPISKPAAQESTPGAEPAQVRGLPGVYQHGRGQYSDNAQGMGFATGFTGQPSAQNMQAANALASQQQAQSMGRIAMQQQAQQQMQQPRGFAAPQIDHSGNSSTSKDELRRLRWAAESAIANAPRKKYAMQDPAVMAYQAALQGDMAARYGGQAALEAKTNDTNAGLQREQMQQQGANQRDAGRLAIDQQRLGLDAKQQQEQSTARGFEIRDAQRREGILQQFDAAKTDQERAQLQQRYPDVFGKVDSPWKVSVTPATKNIDGSTSMGSVIRYNDQTGQVEEVKLNGAAQPQAAPQDAAKRVVGQIYVGPNGKVAMWNGKDWTPV